MNTSWLNSVKDRDESDPETAREARTQRLVDGFNFIFGEPERIPAVWGVGENILWSEGEGVMLVGHQGVGKTTIAQQAVLHRIGVRDGDLLGLRLARDDRPVLYLAMDRPRQAARSFRRMVEHGNHGPLQRMLRVWRGPLPVNILSSTAVLADFVQEVCPGAGTLVIDSVKDLAPGINKDEVGAAINSAWQEVIARDIQLMTIHHQRKAQNGASRTNTLDDVYGSTWLTSGLGSVIVIEGQPGDTTVELHHLKQPSLPVGPFKVRHDHTHYLR